MSNGTGANSETGMIQGQIDSAQNELNTAQQQASQAADQVTASNATLDSINNEINAVQEQLASLQSQQSSISAWLNQVSQSQQDAADNSAALQTETDSLGQYLDTQEGRDNPNFDNLVSLYQQMQSGEAPDAALIAGLQSQSQFFSNELSQILSDAANLSAAIAQEQAQLPQAGAAAQQATQNYTQLQAAADSIKNDVAELTQQMYQSLPDAPDPGTPAAGGNPGPGDVAQDPGGGGGDPGGE